MSCWRGPTLKITSDVYDLSAMRDGILLEHWSAPDQAPLTLAVGVLVGTWLLIAGFRREAQRLKWAWARPRNLTTRNASETPQTIGVILNAALGLFGIWSGLIVLFRSSDVTMPWWAVFAWVTASWLMRMIAGRLLVNARDVATTWVEISRHNQTWIGLTLASWCIVACMNPFVHHTEAAPWGAVVLFSVAMFFSSIRTSQVFNAARHQQVVGILYLCVLEWSWTLFWISWSIRAVLRGH